LSFKNNTIMNIKISLIILFLGSYSWVFAQVGIGNPNPDTSSVLDLTNPNNKGLLLPKASSQAAMSPSVGMMYSFENNLFFRGINGYNSISPWKFKFNGDISNHVFYNLDGNIGIGNTDITLSPEAPLQIETDIAVSLNDNGSLLLGKLDSSNLVFNSSEIQSRNNGNAATLTINRNGGDVTLGSEQTPSNLKVSNKSKGVDHSTNTYYDLMPTGAIVMWSGTSSDIPIGWGICDGGKYAKSHNKNDSIIAPDLSGEFIVMAGDNGITNYDIGDTGGLDSVQITMETMANHQHYSHDLGHTHGYTYQAYYNHNDGHSGVGYHVSGNWQKVSSSTGSAYPNIAQNYVGGNQKHENRPSFYALVYIIKL